MATPTVASPRGVRSAVACFFSLALASRSRKLFVIGLFISFFFIRGGYRISQSPNTNTNGNIISKLITAVYEAN